MCAHESDCMCGLGCLEQTQASHWQYKIRCATGKYAWKDQNRLRVKDFFLSDLGNVWNFCRKNGFHITIITMRRCLEGKKSKLFGLAAIQYLTCNSDAILFFIHIYDTVIQRDVLKTTGRRSSFCVSLVLSYPMLRGLFSDAAFQEKRNQLMNH